jgi:hypothetical protein
MRTIDINEALGRFEELVEEAAAGNPFIVSVNGVSKVRFEPLESLDENGLTPDESTHDSGPVGSSYAVVLAQNSSKARMSSPAICWAVACSMT